MDNRQLAKTVKQLVRGNRWRRSPRLILAIVALLVGYVVLQPVLERRFGVALPHLFDSTVSHAPVAGEQSILDAFHHQRSDIIVQATARVERILPDDAEGDRHQKCILRLLSGHSLLLAHNIDLASRIPLDEGDTVEFRGEYEYSSQGGVIHWTHHDPRGHHAPGWVKHQGRIYE